MLTKGHERTNAIPQILLLVHIIIYTKHQHVNRDMKRMLEPYTYIAPPIRTAPHHHEHGNGTDDKAPNNSQRDMKNGAYKSGRVYGSNFGPEGGYVVQNAAIVERNNPPTYQIFE